MKKIIAALIGVSALAAIGVSTQSEAGFFDTVKCLVTDCTSVTVPFPQPQPQQNFTNFDRSSVISDEEADEKEADERAASRGSVISDEEADERAASRGSVSGDTGGPRGDTGGVRSPSAPGGGTPPGPSGGALLNPLKFGTIPQLLTALVEIILILALPIIVFFIIYGGFLLVTAQGNESQIEKGKTTLTWAIVGGVIVLGAQALIVIIEATVASFRS